jgi:hypothetical protein
LLLGAAAQLHADVDLVTVPRREGTQLTIYNSEDITMVREHRLLTVKKGVNRIQFSWANTLIDPSSIDFRILDHQDQVDLLDTTFPAGRNDALQWNIRSEMAGKIPVEIRYFTSGITWAATYVGIANQQEDRLRLTGYVRVDNRSGELYDNAQTRLVVGTINLVEKIADLARRPPPTAQPMPEAPADSDPFGATLELRDKVLMDALVEAEAGLVEQKKVVKQGLSEYFLFAIEGREDIQDSQPKQLVCLEVDEVPLECLYKLSDRDGGQQFTKFYRFENTRLLDDSGSEAEMPDMNNLGLSPLPDGAVRLYSEYDNRDLAYVGGTTVKYVPIGDRVEVNVGAEPDITMTRKLLDQGISNVVARQYERRLDDNFILHYDLLDYDETFTYEEQLVSGKSGEVRIEVERRFDADVVLWSEDAAPADWAADKPGAYVDLHKIPGRKERVDQNHVKYFLDLAPGKKTTVTYRVTYKRRKIGPELNPERIRRPL